jgi:hypothetical protein
VFFGFVLILPICLSSWNAEMQAPPDGTDLLSHQEWKAKGEVIAIHYMLVPGMRIPLDNYDEMACCRQPEGSWQPCALRAAAEPQDLEPTDNLPSDNILLAASSLLEHFYQDHTDDPRAVNAIYFSLCLTQLEDKFLPQELSTIDDMDMPVNTAYNFLQFPPLLELLLEEAARDHDDMQLCPGYRGLIDLLDYYSAHTESTSHPMARPCHLPLARPHHLPMAGPSHATILGRKSLFLYATNEADTVKQFPEKGGHIPWDLVVPEALTSVLSVVLQVLDATAQGRFVQLARRSLDDANAVLGQLRHMYKAEPLRSVCASLHSLECALFYNKGLAIFERIPTDPLLQDVLYAFFACAVHEVSPARHVSAKGNVLFVENAQARKDLLVEVPTSPSITMHRCTLMTIFTVHTAPAAPTSMSITPPPALAASAAAAAAAAGRDHDLDLDCFNRVVPTVYNGIRMLQTQVWKTQLKFHLVYSSPTTLPFDLTRISLINGAVWSSKMSTLLSTDANFLQHFQPVPYSPDVLNFEFGAQASCLVLLSWNPVFHDRAAPKVVEMLHRMGLSPTVAFYRQFPA